MGFHPTCWLQSEWFQYPRFLCPGALGFSISKLVKTNMRKTSLLEIIEVQPISGMSFLIGQVVFAAGYLTIPIEPSFLTYITIL